MFVYSMQASAFTVLSFFDFCNSCIYKVYQTENILVYNIRNIIVKQSIYYFDFEDLESQKILVGYNWLIM